MIQKWEIPYIAGVSVCVLMQVALLAFALSIGSIFLVIFVAVNLGLCLYALIHMIWD